MELPCPKPHQSSRTTFTSPDFHVLSQGKQVTGQGDKTKHECDCDLNSGHLSPILQFLSHLWG